MSRHNHVTVVQIGGYPPPHGGVGIHIEELVRRLRASSITCGVLKNTAAGISDPGEPDARIHCFSGNRGRQFAEMFLALQALAPEIVHVHMAFGANALPWAAAFACAPRLRASLITVHSGLFPQVVASLTPIRRYIWGRALNCFSHLIAVNPHIRHSLLGLGIADDKIRVIPAFFQPEDPADHPSAPELTELRARCGVLVFTSGFMHPDWGFLSTARALTAIKHLNPGLVIIQSGENNPEYEMAVRAAVADASKLLLWREITHDRFLTALKVSDIYIRASLYDGDSLAVREALAFGKQVLASDCVVRPTGCTLYATNSQAELDAALQQAAGQPHPSESYFLEAGSEDLLQLYAGLLNRPHVERHSAALQE